MVVDVQITPPTFMHSVRRGQNDTMIFENGLVCLIFLDIFLMMGGGAKFDPLPPPHSCLVNVG